MFNRLELEAEAANEEKMRKDTEIQLAEAAVAEISRLLLETEFQVSECFSTTLIFLDYFYVLTGQ